MHHVFLPTSPTMNIFIMYCKHVLRKHFWKVFVFLRILSLDHWLSYSEYFSCFSPSFYSRSFPFFHLLTFSFTFRIWPYLQCHKENASHKDINSPSNHRLFFSCPFLLCWYFSWLYFWSFYPVLYIFSLVSFITLHGHGLLNLLLLPLR